MRDKKLARQNLLRTAALTIIWVGTASSLHFMFSTGNNQKSILLLGLFTAWVISPFVGLLLTDRLSKRWTEIFRIWLYLIMIILTVASLIVYSGIFTLTQTPPAFKFLFIPFLSWLVILAILLIAKQQSRKGKKQT